MKGIGKDQLLIRVFGDERPRVKEAEIVQIALKSVDGMEIYINAYVVPHICSPVTNQVMGIDVERYEHLKGLQLVDYTEGDELNPDQPCELLIGSENFWLLVEDEIIRGEMNGPVAVRTKLGWVVSGQVKGVNRRNVEMSHVLRFDSVIVEDREADPLLNEVKKFWEVESVGCQESKPDTVQKKFDSEIGFENGRYEVKKSFQGGTPGSA